MTPLAYLAYRGRAGGQDPCASSSRIVMNLVDSVLASWLRNSHTKSRGLVRGLHPPSRGARATKAPRCSKHLYKVQGIGKGAEPPCPGSARACTERSRSGQSPLAPLKHPVGGWAGQRHLLPWNCVRHLRSRTPAENPLEGVLGCFSAACKQLINARHVPAQRGDGPNLPREREPLRADIRRRLPHDLRRPHALAMTRRA